MARTEVELGHIEEEDLDYGRAGILLHDVFKQGLPPRDEYETQNDHDRVASRYLGRKADLPDEVLGCIDSHNGAWYQGKEPETELEKLHHRADYISSRKAAWFDVLNPCEELREVIHERKTDEEQAVLGRVSALSTAVEASDFVDEFTLPGVGDVNPDELSKVVKFIANGGEQ